MGEEEVEDEKGQTRKRGKVDGFDDEDDIEASESEDVEIDDNEDGPCLDDKILDKFGSDNEEEDDEHEEDDDGGDSDSDGYGEAGLSFESILADVRGDVKEK